MAAQPPRRPNPRPVAPAASPVVVPTSTSRYVRKKKPFWKSPVLWMFVVALGAFGGGATWYLTQRSLALVAPGEQTAVENEPFRLTLQTRVKGLRPGDYRFELVQGPPGVAVDANSGAVSWTPSESQGPGRYDVQVRAVALAHTLPEATASWTVVVAEDSQPPKLAAVPDQVLDLNQTKTLTLALQGADDDLPQQALRYELIDGRQYGAALDAATGTFTFDGASAKPNQTFAFTVAVFDAEKVASKAVTFQIKTTGPPPAYEAFVEQARKSGLDLKFIGTEPLPLFDVVGKVHTIDRGRLIVYEFPSTEAAATAAAGVKPDASAVGDQPIPAAREAEAYVQDRLIFVYVGPIEPGTRLTVLLGRQLADRTPVVASLPAAMPTAVVTPTEPKPSEFVPLINLYKEKKLFSLAQYAAVRKFYADRFEAANADLIRQIFGADEALLQFLQKHPDVKEEFYTAIDPQYDDTAAALTLFRDLHRQFPAKFRAYSELAVATAVTWDKERQVVDYAGHQKRVHALMPGEQTDAFGNFKYLLDAEPVMQGRIQFLPWEFLVHSVNDRTPTAERIWAVQRYLPKRVMFGECYHDVPYDYEALKTDDRECRLDGKDYTLANLVQFGGVCAHQADFASRVGKSLGVPAEYVGGTASDGIGHAWVMWVELKQVTANSIVFSLESYGRYQSDMYYVGRLRDPHTGQPISDRQLELRLQTVGMNVPAKRHADRVMAAFPAVRDELKLSVKEQLAFLNELLKLCVGNEAGWHAVATIAKESELDAADEKIMVTALDTLFRVFAKVPDFTWEVFDDLIGFRKQAKDKIALYQRLIQLYDQADRADLACNAVMRLADMMAAENQAMQACQGLMATIMRYPDEGRYVPKLVDQLDKLSEGLPGADAAFVAFYQKFLPTIPRGTEGLISPYCIAMYQRGIKKYRATGNETLAVEAEAELQKIKSIGKN